MATIYGFDAELSINGQSLGKVKSFALLPIKRPLIDRLKLRWQMFKIRHARTRARFFVVIARLGQGGGGLYGAQGLSQDRVERDRAYYSPRNAGDKN